MSVWLSIFCPSFLFKSPFFLKKCRNEAFSCPKYAKKPLQCGIAGAETILPKNVLTPTKPLKTNQLQRQVFGRCRYGCQLAAGLFSKNDGGRQFARLKQSAVFHYCLYRNLIAFCHIFQAFAIGNPYQPSESLMVGGCGVFQDRF